MKVLLVPDSFKGSLSSKEVIRALKRGFQKFDPSIELFSCIASDGGEGFLDFIQKHLDLETITEPTVDPLGRPIKSSYLWDKKNHVAYVELARASGYELLKTTERNPMFTSTIGSGIQIKQACEKGAKVVFVGLGGSATNDGGIGIASQLGYSFINAEGKGISPVGLNLNNISKIKGRLSYPNVSFIAINDVDNVLHGPNGAAQNYAKQKGASPKEIEQLDKGLKRLDHIVKEQLYKEYADLPGTGAAGGSGYGIKTFLNGSFISGTDFFFKISQIEKLIIDKKIDCIVTGEGCIDHLSSHGKLIKGIARIAQPLSVKVVAICGKLELNDVELVNLGIDYATSIAPSNVSTAESIEKAAYYIEERVKDLLPNL